jgi:putative lipoprotein
VGKSRTVQGEIVLPAAGVSPGPADVIVFVEDISRADAPSVVVGKQQQKGVLLRPGLRFPFAVQIPNELIDERHLYSIGAHIDRSGSGEVKIGDFVSTQTCPVLTRGHEASVTINVRRV